jgi:hypothetical protein
VLFRFSFFRELETRERRSKVVCFWTFERTGQVLVSYYDLKPLYLLARGVPLKQNLKRG